MNTIISKKKIWLVGTFIFLCLAMVIMSLKAPVTSLGGLVLDEINVGASYTNAKWFIFDKFDGYSTHDDPTKVSNGANPQGQNTSVNNGDRISIRELGYDIYPDSETYSTSNDSIISVHTFRRRSGKNIFMRTWGGQLDYFNEVASTWEKLSEGYATGTPFGFADNNINTDLSSYTYFGNGAQSWSRWNGAVTNVNGALSGGEDRIVVNSADGFTDTGSVSYCGTEQAYTYRVTTTTPSFILTGTATACADNRGVAQAVLTDSSKPKGNIYLVAHNRLFIAGVASSTQAVFFSAYGDATDFSTISIVSDSTDTSPGIFNLGEGGGGVTGMALDEEAIYVFKKSIIYKVTLDDTTYTLKPLKPFDGKSQTIGAINNNSIFTGGNGIFFITPDNQIMNLTRVETVDYPQVVPISDIIKPTVDAMRFASSTGIVFREKAYFSVKATDESAINDTVLVWNISTNKWDSPILGWNAADWTVYNDDALGDGQDELYFGDHTDANIFKVNNTPLDYIYDVTANWRSKQFNFGAPQVQKEIVDFYVTGYIADNTSLTISLLLDEDGYTQNYTTTLVGTEADYIYDSSEYNLFGFSAFGTKRFGSNEDETGKKKFRVYLVKSFRTVPFYNAQVEFSSEGENQNWEVLSYAMKVREHSQERKTQLMRSW